MEAGGNLYRPLTSLSFAIDRLVARGLRPGWFHFVNLLLHGVVTWLVVRLTALLGPGTAGPAGPSTATSRERCLGARF